VADERKATEDVQREEAATSEADASEGTQGNTDSLHTTNIIEIESSSASPSYSTSISNLSDLDDVPLNKIYTTINKGPSPSTKLKKKPCDETFEPMYPSVLERIGEMSQMRVDVCARLPADHPLQPPMIELIQSLPADAEGVDEPAGFESTNISESSNHKSTTQTTEPSMLDDLVNHYSGELPSYEPNQEKASEVSSDGVALESPQQQSPNSQMASSTCTEIFIHPEQQPYHLNATHSNISFGIALRNLAKKIKPVPEQHVPEQVLVEQLESQTSIEQINEPDFMIISDSSNGKDEQTDSWFKPGFLNKFAWSSSTMISESVPNQPNETNTLLTEPILATETLTNDQPSSSNQALQTCAHARSTNVPFPPTLFLDSTLLADVCENIFQELNKLIEARNNLVHEDI